MSNWVRLGLLNTLDSALTALGLHLGVFAEANPIVNAIGLLPKTLLVWALGYLVARLGFDHWLVLPIVIYAVVVLYQIVGIVLMV